MADKEEARQELIIALDVAASSVVGKYPVLNKSDVFSVLQSLSAEIYYKTGFSGEPRLTNQVLAKQEKLNA